MNTKSDSLNWDNLRYFAAVVDYGSISAAARAIGVSQPTISRHLAALEQRLGVRLLERQASGIALTSQGKALMEQASAMRDIATTICHPRPDAALTGTVLITASQIVSCFGLPLILPGLRAEQPGLSIEIVASDTPQNLSRRDADIAIRHIRPKGDGLIAKKLGTMPVAMYGATSYLARNGTPHDRESLLDHTLIGYDRSTRLIDGFAKAGFVVKAEDFQLRTDDQVLYWHMICAGFGLGFASRFLGDQNPELERIDLPGASGEDPVWLVAHAQLNTNPRIRYVFDYIARMLPEHLYLR